jgi:hypothetical protein
VDLVRAFVGQDGFQVVRVAQHRVVEGDAAGAEQRPAFPGDLERRAHVVQFAEADLRGGEACPVLEPA